MEIDKKIQAIIDEIKDLKQKVREKEKTLAILLSKKENSSKPCKYSKELLTSDISRYTRQMLVDEVQLKGQIKLKNSSVLIVGAGGLGCAAAIYLAGAGVGEITIVDFDEVELTNLHRQILHTEDDIGLAKVDSAYDKLNSLNRSIKIIPLKEHLNETSIRELFGENQYDCVIDGSDNVPTRYLLSDTCVLNQVPLVSGSALQTEGQLTVYNYKGGPCYRCVFPVPPPPEAVTSCGDGGVLGPVPGVIGVMQALQTIKVITEAHAGILTERYLIFDASTTRFRTVKLRPKVPTCELCKHSEMKDHMHYETFLCKLIDHDKAIDINVMDDSDNISVRDFATKIGDSLILDVRPVIQYNICHIPHTVNVPYPEIEKQAGLDKVRSLLKDGSGDHIVYVICRRGNDSQKAVLRLKAQLKDCSAKFVNVRGGLLAYAKEVDSDFPIY